MDLLGCDELMELRVLLLVGDVGADELVGQLEEVLLGVPAQHRSVLQPQEGVGVRGAALLPLEAVEVVHHPPAEGRDPLVLEKLAEEGVHPAVEEPGGHVGVLAKEVVPLPVVQVLQVLLSGLLLVLLLVQGAHDVGPVAVVRGESEEQRRRPQLPAHRRDLQQGLLPERRRAPTLLHPTEAPVAGDELLEELVLGEVHVGQVLTVLVLQGYLVHADVDGLEEALVLQPEEREEEVGLGLDEATLRQSHPVLQVLSQREADGPLGAGGVGGRGEEGGVGQLLHILVHEQRERSVALGRRHLDHRPLLLLLALGDGVDVTEAGPLHGQESGVEDRRLPAPLVVVLLLPAVLVVAPVQVAPELGWEARVLDRRGSLVCGLDQTICELWAVLRHLCLPGLRVPDLHVSVVPVDGLQLSQGVHHPRGTHQLALVH